MFSFIASLWKSTSRRVIYASIVFVFFPLIALSSFISYSDNGDYSRSVGFVFDKPSGFAENWPSPGTDEWRRRFFNNSLDQWELYTDMPRFDLVYTISSYKLYLAVQILFERLVGSEDSLYSVVIGSMLSRVLIMVFLCLLIQRSYKDSGFFSAVVISVIASALYLDSSYVAFLNSFYEEQVALIFLPILLLGLYKYYESRGVLAAIVCLFIGLFIGAAKVAYFYLPTLVMLFTLVRVKNLKKWMFVVLPVYLFAQYSAIIPVKMSKYQEVNAYHSMYYGILIHFNDSELESLSGKLEKTMYKECIGESAFTAVGGKCVERARINRTDFIKAFVYFPEKYAVLFHSALLEGASITLGHINFGPSGFEHIKNVAVFNVAKNFMSPWLHVAILGMMATCVLLAYGEKRRVLSANFALGLFLVLFGYGQYLISLGDGLFDLKKHVIIGNLCLMLSIGFFMGSVLKRESLTDAQNRQPVTPALM